MHILGKNLRARIDNYWSQVANTLGDAIETHFLEGPGVSTFAANVQPSATPSRSVATESTNEIGLIQARIDTLCRKLEGQRQRSGSRPSRRPSSRSLSTSPHYPKHLAPIPPVVCTMIPCEPFCPPDADKIPCNYYSETPADTHQFHTEADRRDSRDIDPPTLYLNLEKYDPQLLTPASLPLRVIFPTFALGVQPECILDGGAQVVVTRKDIWQKLRALAYLDCAISIQSTNSQTTTTFGLVPDHPVQLGPITIYLQIQVVEEAPFEVLLGRPFFDITSCSEVSTSGGGHEIQVKDPKTGASLTFVTAARICKTPREFTMVPVPLEEVNLQLANSSPELVPTVLPSPCRYSPPLSPYSETSDVIYQTTENLVDQDTYEPDPLMVHEAPASPIPIADLWPFVLDPPLSCRNESPQLPVFRTSPSASDNDLPWEPVPTSPPALREPVPLSPSQSICSWMKDLNLDKECAAPVINFTAPDRDHNYPAPTSLEQLKEPGTESKDNPFSSLNTMVCIFALLQGSPGDPPPF